MGKFRLSELTYCFAVFCLATTVASNAQTAPDFNNANTFTPTTFASSGLSFASAVSYETGSLGAYDVAIADVNGDGKLDLIVANCGTIVQAQCDGPSTVGVLLGNGDGTFQKAVTYPSGGFFAMSVAVADFNGDGKPDIAVLNNEGDNGANVVAVLLNNGDGTFQAPVGYLAGGFESITLATADVNSDGIPDLVVVNAEATTQGGPSRIGVLLGNGDGTFQAPVSYNPGGTALGGNGGVAIADVNGDGNPDLLVALCSLTNSCATGQVGVLLGNGDGTFQTAATYDTGENLAGAISVVDVNGDGKQDLVVSDFCTSTCDNGAVSVLLGNGDGTFQAGVAYPSGGFYPITITTADVNSDGIPDILVNNCGNGSMGSNECFTVNSYIGVLLGNGDGTFQPTADLNTGGSSSYGIATADLTGNGKLDIVTSNCIPTNNGACGEQAGTVGVLINTNTVSRAASRTAMASSLNPSVEGQAVKLSAKVSVKSGTPTGTISFFDGSTNLGDAPLNANGVATFTISTLPAATDHVTAVYSGNTTLAPSTSPVLQQVVGQATSTTTVTSSVNPSTVGQTVTFTATVVGQHGGTPSGFVVFKDGTTVLGKVRLKDKVATLSTSSLTQGQHTIRAQFQGSVNFTGSVGGVIQTVN